MSSPERDKNEKIVRKLENAEVAQPPTGNFEEVDTGAMIKVEEIPNDDYHAVREPLPDIVAINVGENEQASPIILNMAGLAPSRVGRSRKLPLKFSVNGDYAVESENSSICPAALCAYVETSTGQGISTTEFNESAEEGDSWKDSKSEAEIDQPQIEQNTGFLNSLIFLFIKLILIKYNFRRNQNLKWQVKVAIPNVNY